MTSRDDQRLVVLSGPRAGGTVLVGQELSVGRSGTCNLTLRDPKVSRRHATLRRASDRLHLRDEGSLNGTWLNGRRIAAEQPLSAGDIVRIGSSELVVSNDATGAPDALLAWCAEHADDDPFAGLTWATTGGSERA
jgi:pSer/pThr/pTyr-binding forkhead associated (FHA) protein